jgi:hypothetical protein
LANAASLKKYFVQLEESIWVMALNFIAHNLPKYNLFSGIVVQNEADKASGCFDSCPQKG